MSSHSRPSIGMTLLTAVLCTAACASEPGMDDESTRSADFAFGKFSPPRQTMLALGDSLAFGFQPGKGSPNPANFKSGFVTKFAARLDKTPQGKGIGTVNYGCPGETLPSFLNGPCKYQSAGLPLHNGYTGSQIAAAESFLAANRGRVSPILVAIGSNDAAALLSRCGGLKVNMSCVTAGLPELLGSVARNLDEVLTRLNKAAPDAEIIIVDTYNPLAAAVPATNVVSQTVNAVMLGCAAKAKARVAHVFPPFNLATPQPQTLCTYTLMCNLRDVHPSDLGYQVMADTAWQASGYTRYEP